MEVDTKVDLDYMPNNKALIGSNNIHYLLVAITAIVSIGVFVTAYLFEHEFSNIMHIAAYLTWHNIFEFSGILVSLVVFVVAYYTYDQTHNVRMLVFGSIFLAVGFIDTFHTLSFKGMPAFLIENTAANRATTFWIISRTVVSIGFFAFLMIKEEINIGLNKKFFFMLPMIFSLAILILCTYYPYVLPAMYIEGQGLTKTKVLMEYVIIAVFFISAAMALKGYNRNKDFLMALLAVAITLNIFSELAFTSYYSVYDVFNYLGHIYKFIATFIVFRIMFIHNVQKPYYELSQAKNELRQHAENLDKIVDDRTRELRLMNLRFLEDLEYAKDVQKAFLPVNLPREEQIVFEARCYPAERVSGDFYNIVKLDDEHIGLYIGDVSGHGVAAAMLTVFLNQNIKLTKELEGNRQKILKPSEVLDNLYRSFNHTNFKEDIYTVMIYGIYCITTGEFTYSSAGMNASPLIINQAGGVRELEIMGFPICKLFEYYPVDYMDTTVRLNKGDKILFLTDGLTEAKNSAGAHYSEERLKSFLEVNANLDDAALSEAISQHVFAFIGSNEINDDITYLIMHVK